MVSIWLRACATVAVILVLTPGMARGQTRFSLRQAIDTALESRALLKAEAERVAAAEGRKRQAGALPNPEVQFSNENLRPGQTYTRDVDTLAYVTWPLDVLGKRGQRIDLAERTVARTAAEADLARRQVTRQVGLAYWTARGAQERRDALQAAAANFQRIVDYHRARLSVGAIAEQDVLRVQLEGERIEIAAGIAAIDAASARVDLLRDIGRTDLSDVVLIEPLDAAPPASAMGSVQAALSQRSEIKVASATVEEARANVRAQEVAARPDLEVFYGYKRTQLPDAISGVNTALAGIKVTVPLFDRNLGSRAAAASELKRQEQLTLETQSAVRADFNHAFEEYTMRRAQVVDTLQPLREHANTISTIAQAAYQQGGVELLRLLDAERSRLDAESAWIDGMVAFQKSVTNLQAAQGAER